jgi:hypothetical protein
MSVSAFIPIHKHGQKWPLWRLKVKENMEDPQIYHIPTLLNGKTGNKYLKLVSSEVTYKNNVVKSNTA